VAVVGTLARLLLEGHYLTVAHVMRLSGRKYDAAREMLDQLEHPLRLRVATPADLDQVEISEALLRHLESLDGRPPCLWFRANLHHAPRPPDMAIDQALSDLFA